MSREAVFQLASGLSVNRQAAVRPAREPHRPGLTQSEFIELYEGTQKGLSSYLRHTTGDVGAAQDLAQESYLRLLRSGFRGEDLNHTKNYLFRIATNLARDRSRRRRRRPFAISLEQLSEDPFAPQPAAAERSDETSLRGDLMRLLHELKPRDRQLLWLAHVEQMSHREVALILGIGERSVRSMLFRARKRLAKRLESAGLAGERSANP